MKLVAGEGKKGAGFWAVWRGRGGELGESAQILDALTNILNTHTTMGGPPQGGPWPKKIMPWATNCPEPIGQGFLGSKMVRKGLGTKRFDQKKGPRGCLGQKWCGPNEVRKTKKTWKNKSKKEISLSPSPKTKNEKTKKKKKNIPKIKKMKNLSPPRPKNQKNQKINNKIKK